MLFAARSELAHGIVDHEVWRLRWTKDNARMAFRRVGRGIKRKKEEIGTVESILATLSTRESIK